MRYAIKILMIGDVGSSEHRLEMFYRNNRVTIENATVSQDFCAMKGSKPTTYAQQAKAEVIATRLVKKCTELHEELKTYKITRHFIVRVVPYDVQE